MARKRNPSDKRQTKWSDHQAQWCDGQVSVCMASVTSEANAAKRLRIATGLLRQVPELRELRRQAIRDLRSQGKTWRSIGAVIGASAQAVNQMVNRKREFPR